MSDLVLETPEGVALRFELAGAGTRVLAAALDGLLFVLALLAGFLFLELTGLGIGSALLLGGAVVLLVTYSFAFSFFWNGRTPGKVWTGIRVCDQEGFAAHPSQHFLRALFVPFEALLVFPFPLVWMLIAATPRHQRLGDLVAGTLVLHERRRRAPPEPAPNLRWSTLERRSYALDPAVARELEGRELGFLRDLLTRADLEPRARAHLYRRAARHFAARLQLAPREFTPGEARVFLRELFLLLRELRAEKPATPGRPAEGASARGRTRASAPLPR